MYRAGESSTHELCVLCCGWIWGDTEGQHHVLPLQPPQLTVECELMGVDSQKFSFAYLHMLALQGSHSGSTIDNADAVIRCNDAPTAGDVVMRCGPIGLQQR